MKHWISGMCSGLFFLVTATVTTAQTSPPFHQCPSVGADSSCAILIIVTDTGVQVATDLSQGPFDRIEDTLVGVQNNSSGIVSALPLSAATPIFSFDGDGLCLFITCTWPHPTTYEGRTSTGGAVSFSSINAAQTSGTVNFGGGIPPGGSAFFGLELRIQTLCNPLTVQPTLKQFSSPWGPHTYDNATTWAGGQTAAIARWGCHLTSAVMLINYQASQQHHSFRTDPDDLNNWLEANSAPYQQSGSIWGPDVQKYVAEQTNGTLGVFYQGRIDVQDDFALDNYLCTNNPIILQVPLASSTHFVLATGQTIIGTTNTFNINDPNYNYTDLSGYGFSYIGLRQYSASPAAPHALLVTGHSPIELVITDPAGKRTGFDPTTGSHFLQIPSSSYATDSINDDIDPGSGNATPVVKNLEVLTPLSGTYSLKVFGTAIGGFTLDFVAHDNNGNQSFHTLTGSTIPGAIAEFAITYSSTLGSTVSVSYTVSFASVAVDLGLARNLKLIDSDGVSNSLLQKLRAANAARTRGQVGTAGNILRAFVNEVSAQAGQHISETVASLLTNDAQALISSLAQ